jgi:hypothetical protein
MQSPCATPDQAPQIDFYVAEILSFDGDVSDIINTTKLRAIAIHRPSKKNFPFFGNDMAEWLGNRVGSKHMATLESYFLPEAFFDRAKRRPSTSIRSILKADREKLIQLTQQKRGRIQR